jgi:hypothetical protein
MKRTKYGKMCETKSTSTGARRRRYYCQVSGARKGFMKRVAFHLTLVNATG